MMPYNSPAYQQHEQETLEALDRLIFAGQGYRAAVAAHQPSVAVSLQLLADAGRVVAETGQMSGLANAALVVREKAA
jgi:hypothetical protein